MEIINENLAKHILSDEKAVLKAVENIFYEYAKGDAVMSPKTYLDVAKGDDYRAMPSYSQKYACIKWIADYTSNKSKGLPTTQAIIVLNDKESGAPLAIIEANHITKLRTAAATALATRELVEDKHIKKISFIGCGDQTLPHINFLTQVLGQVDEIFLYDIDAQRAHALAADYPHIQVSGTLEECVEGSRVVTTLTPSRKPYLSRSMLPEVCHINAVGADAIGKRELCEDIFGDGAFFLVCDDYNQAKHSGEAQYLQLDQRQAIMSLCDLFSSVWYRRPVTAGALSVYDATGLAIEDLALAEDVFNATLAQSGRASDL